jgi:hypothetical protein
LCLMDIPAMYSSTGTVEETIYSSCRTSIVIGGHFCTKLYAVSAVQDQELIKSLVLASKGQRKCPDT